MAVWIVDYKEGGGGLTDRRPVRIPGKTPWGPGPVLWPEPGDKGRLENSCRGRINGCRGREEASQVASGSLVWVTGVTAMKWDQKHRRKSVKLKKTSIWYHLYVESKKIIQMNLFTKQKQTHRQRKQTYGYQRGKEESHKKSTEE